MIYFLSLCFLSAVFAAPIDPDIEAFQKHVQKEAEHLWITMDSNKNGEFDRTDLETLIHEYDMDGDNEVTRDEFEYKFDMAEPTLAIVAKGLFAEYDDNQDGFITTKDLDDVHDRMDHIIKDGRVDHAEFVAYQVQLLTVLYALQAQMGQP